MGRNATKQLIRPTGPLVGQCKEEGCKRCISSLSSRHRQNLSRVCHIRHRDGLWRNGVHQDRPAQLPIRNLGQRGGPLLGRRGNSLAIRSLAAINRVERGKLVFSALANTCKGPVCSARHPFMVQLCCSPCDCEVTGVPWGPNGNISGQNTALGCLGHLQGRRPLGTFCASRTARWLSC